MPNYINLKLPGLDERHVLLTKKQYVNITAINTITRNINSTTVTTSTIMPKAIKVVFSRNMDGES